MQLEIVVRYLFYLFKNLEKMRESKPYAKNTIEAMLGVNI